MIYTIIRFTQIPPIVFPIRFTNLKFHKLRKAALRLTWTLCGQCALFRLRKAGNQFAASLYSPNQLWFAAYGLVTYSYVSVCVSLSFHSSAPNRYFVLYLNYRC